MFSCFHTLSGRAGTRFFQVTAGLLAALVVSAGTAATAQEPTNFEELLEIIDQKTVDRDAWSSDIEMAMSMGAMQMSYEGVTKISGSMSRTDMQMELRGQTSTMVTVTDADNMQWTAVDRGGVQQIVRVDMNRLTEALGPEVMEKSSLGQGAGTPVDVSKNARVLLEEYASSYDMAYLGTGDHPDGKIYIVEGNKKADEGELTGMAADLARAGMVVEQLKMTIGVDDGFPRSIEWFGTEHQPIMTVKYSNVSLNPEFATDEFVFSPPVGSTVSDMTTSMEQRIRQQQLLQQSR